MYAGQSEQYTTEFDEMGLTKVFSFYPEGATQGSPLVEVTVIGSGIAFSKPVRKWWVFTEARWANHGGVDMMSAGGGGGGEVRVRATNRMCLGEMGPVVYSQFHPFGPVCYLQGARKPNPGGGALLSLGPLSPPPPHPPP